MSTHKTPSSTGEEWLSKITSLFETSDKNLDQVKKSVQDDLDKLRKESTLEGLAANFYLSAEAGFKKDLNEIGINGDAQAPYLVMLKEAWGKQEISKKSSEILNSPELNAMNGFISHIENLPKLKEVIDSAEPQAKWQTMLTGFGFGPEVNKFFGPILSALGLGFLVKPKKKAEEKKEADKKKNDEQKNEKPDENKENKEVRGKPKSTVFFGDSNTVAMTGKSKDILKIDGQIKSVAQVGKSAQWGLEKIKAMAAKKPSPLKGFKNAVVLFGSNDLLVYSPEKEIGFLRQIYKTLKNAGVKNIYAVTIPPVKGYSDYDNNTRANETRNKVNKWIKKSKSAGFSNHVIDLAATESKGGMADDNDPDKLGKKAHSGDGIHFDKRLLASIYQRELEIGTGKTTKKS